MLMKPQNMHELDHKSAWLKNCLIEKNFLTLTKANVGYVEWLRRPMLPNLFKNLQLRKSSILDYLCKYGEFLDVISLQIY